MENIRYGRPDATDEEVIEAAEIAEAAAFVTSLPSGWKRWLAKAATGFRADNVNASPLPGPCSRMHRCWCLMKRRRPLTTKPKPLCSAPLNGFPSDRTTIVIAHRLSTVRNADRIVVLEKVSVVEDGQHDALVRQGGIYARLWSVQTGEVQ